MTVDHISISLSTPFDRILHMAWIGVDLDGTLAEYHGWHGPDDIGEPIPLMMSRVMSWLEAGIEVRIFTARASNPKMVPAVRQWLKDNGLGELAITNEKDYEMMSLWDDRCIQIEHNTGKRIDGKLDM